MVALNSCAHATFWFEHFLNSTGKRARQGQTMQLWFTLFEAIQSVTHLFFPPCNKAAESKRTFQQNKTYKPVPQNCQTSAAVGRRPVKLL